MYTVDRRLSDKRIIKMCSFVRSRIYSYVDINHSTDIYIDLGAAVYGERRKTR